MSLLTRAWIAAARARRRRGRPSPDDWERSRLDWVREHAPGRSFADVGGLFAHAGNVAFAAERAGATAVTEFDAGDAHLTGFTARHEAEGSRIRVVQGDLEDPVSVERLGPHDVVWCTGVVYHTPNPVRQLMLLRTVTRELLYLGTHTIPEVPGLRHACVYYPHLDAGDRRAYAAPHWEPEREGMVGLGTPFDDAPMHGHANFWWGISPSALRAMLRTARFEVVEERRNHQTPFNLDVVARPVARPPSLPPPSYYRERAERRERGEPEPPLDGYYDERPEPSAAFGAPPG